MNKTRIVTKRTSLREKIWYVAKPYLIYTILKTTALILMYLMVQTMALGRQAQWIEQNASALSAAINAAASMIAAAFMLNDFLVEVSVCGEIDIDAGVLGRLADYIKTGLFRTKGENGHVKLLFSFVSGATLAVLFNIAIMYVTNLFGLEGMLGSRRYKEVEHIQYAVPVWLGMLLFGFIAPVVEEMVFRGIIYSRLRKFFGLFKSIIVSTLLFGIFHGNFAQFIYASLMGIFMALFYEWAGCFGAPMLFHMGANIFVYLISTCTVM